MQLKVVILPLDASGELMDMLAESEDEPSRRSTSTSAKNFGIGFMTLAEVGPTAVTHARVEFASTPCPLAKAEVYHPLVLASLACEMRLQKWHGSRWHTKQVQRLSGYADGCGSRPSGPGRSV